MESLSSAPSTLSTLSSSSLEFISNLVKSPYFYWSVLAIIIIIATVLIYVKFGADKLEVFENYSPKSSETETKDNLH